MDFVEKGEDVAKKIEKIEEDLSEEKSDEKKPRKMRAIKKAAQNDEIFEIFFSKNVKNSFETGEILKNDEIPALVDVEQILAADDEFFYLDAQNTPKNLEKLGEMIDSRGKNHKINKVHFGLDEKDFVYELHVL